MIIKTTTALGLSAKKIFGEGHIPHVFRAWITSDELLSRAPTVGSVVLLPCWLCSQTHQHSCFGMDMTASSFCDYLFHEERLPMLKTFNSKFWVSL